MKWFVYVLKSLKDNKRYIGSTNDLARRVKEHNLGRVKSTKSRIPLTLIYKEQLLSESDARLREKFFKTHKGFNELRRILNDGV